MKDLLYVAVVATFAASTLGLADRLAFDVASIRLNRGGADQSLDASLRAAKGA